MQLTSTTIIIERKTNGSRQNLNSSQELFSFSKIGRPRPFSFILGLFKTTQILQQINVKNVDPVSGAWIRTHNLQIMSLLLQKNITRPLQLCQHQLKKYLCPFLITIQILIKKVQIQWLEDRTRVARWQAQTDPLCYGWLPP